jgi:catechol 2,3-dioxygenase-like lactoylglutathione lyase family enzyme
MFQEARIRRTGGCPAQMESVSYQSHRRAVSDCVELTKFRRPTADSAEPNNALPNALGIRRIMFAVENIDDVVARLRAHGAELVGELVLYENYRLCYVRGPEGILVALAEKIGRRFGNCRV